MVGFVVYIENHRTNHQAMINVDLLSPDVQNPLAWTAGHHELPFVARWLGLCQFLGENRTPC